MNNTALRGLLGLLAFLSAGVCAAQDEAPQVVVTEKSYIACMTPPVQDRGVPRYPEKALFGKYSGTVEVVLTFTSKDSSPKVRVLNRGNWNTAIVDEFILSVERFAAQYRLPCIGDEPVEIRQSFRFEPDGQKVAASAATQGPSEFSRAGCRFAYEGLEPSYPWGSQRPYGNVYTRLKFNQRDEAPTVTIVYGGGHYLLAEATKSATQRMRLRCESALEKPVETTYLTRYTPPSGFNVGLKDMDFISFLKSVKRESLGKPVFDFNTLSCPFSVRVQLLQPHARNVVAELEHSEPSRSAFLQWMEALVFNYPADYERYLVGETMKVTVPCMALDLS